MAGVKLTPWIKYVSRFEDNRRVGHLNVKDIVSVDPCQ